MRSAALIAETLARLKADFSLHPVTAAEIEFYLPGADTSFVMPLLWESVRARCAAQNIDICKIDAERGRDQYEIALMPALDPVKTARDTAALKEIVAEAASAHKLAADFSARPFPAQPGSGLHIHVHLAEASGKNVFYKDDEKISDALKFSIGGLLTWLPDTMPVFAPHEDSYARFAPGGNAPTTVSWGANNRTVAVRLPDAAHDQKRIEHRVAGSDADPFAVMAAILSAMHYGLTHQIDPGPQIHGDAAMPMYGLPKLPTSLKEAEERMKTSKTIISLTRGGYAAASLSPNGGEG